MDKIELIEQIRTCLSNIKDSMRSLDCSISKISEYIKNSEFIPDNIMMTTISDLEKICSYNENCKEHFINLSGKDMKLAKICDLERELELYTEQAQFEDNVSYANLFLYLHSENADVEDLLDSEKKKLQKLMDCEHDDSLIEKLSPYIIFVKTIDSNYQINDPKLITCIVELNKYFDSDLVSHAALIKDISLDKDELATLNRKSDINSENDKNIHIVSDDVFVIESNEEPVESIEQKDTLEKIESDESEFVKRLLAEQAILPKNLEIVELEKQISSRADKPFGVKDFQNDIRTGDVELKKKILREINDINSVTPQILSWVSNKPVDVINQELDYLQRKGYLTKYEIENIGSFFCTTPKCMKAFTRKDSCSFLGVPFGCNKNDTASTDDTVFAALTRIAYTKSWEIRIGSNVDTDSFTHCLSTESFVLSSNSSDNNDLYLGCFWSNTDDCDEYIENVNNEYLSKYTYGRIIFVGYDKNHTLSVAKALNETLSDTSAKRYIYALTENLFYDIENLCVVPGENIWTQYAVEDSMHDEKKDERIDDNLDDADETEETSIIDNTEALSEHDGALVISEETTATENELKPVSIISAEENAEIMNNVCNMIIADKAYCATAYLYAVSQNTENEKMYDLLSYAINDPIRKCSYISDKIFDILPENHNDFNDLLMISTALRTFFYNHTEYDYMLKSLYDTIREYPIISKNSELSTLVYEIMNFKHMYNKGIDAYADYRAQDKANLEKTLEKIQAEAKEYYDAVILSPITEKTGHKRFIETKKIIFNPKNDIALYLKAIMDKEFSVIPLIKDFLTESFIKNDSTVTFVNIDTEKLNRFMDDNWKKAGEKMRINRISSDLMSRLRSNLENSIRKALKIMCDWIVCTDNYNENENDEPSMQYKTMKKTILSTIDNALSEISYIKESNVGHCDIVAGTIILTNTLKELKSRIEGDYSDIAEKFFYVDFLRSDCVLLNDDYLPDFGYKSLVDTDLSAVNRILKHSTMELLDFDARLEEIFMKKGDDYGSAKLIDDYLFELNGKSVISEKHYDLTQSIEFAKKEAMDAKNKFIEDLELAQSYGQIENSVNNKKELILHTVNEWFEYANNTNNFGFFNKVTEYFLKKIKEDARVREDQLNKELSKLNVSTVTDEQKRKIEKIQEMITIQNYTVAEDLIRRYNDDDVETDFEIFTKDYLKDFIDNYDMYYRSVSDGSKNFRLLVTNHARNKDERGARRLAEHWMINGNNIGSENLRALLIDLGFNIGEVKEQNKINDLYNYIVKLNKPDNGRKTNFKHPIAPFGSQAIDDGFRVILLFGKYDADRLIETIKPLGNAKHTLILLDHALVLRDRRILARKLKKTDAPNKIFGIIDRVMLHYLMRCYNITSINRILMSLMMPFTYNQLYVSESSKVMPPEIFMGRKRELESIEDPGGVNIVYGGRQLGKSALLKMARNDIDRNENGDRAILVDIKGLNYKSAARKISNALFDENILSEDIDTDDWSVLARAIRTRLNNNQPCRIPYFLLLIDEADAFIESCDSVDYFPFDALKEIQSIGTDRFKFVIAGLRNVIRFKRDSALSNNVVLTHFESMTVKPFDYAEGRELIEVPLYYLGLRFPTEKESLISLILASANYFPGLIQLYCAKLIEAMRIGYAGYDENNTPEYIVQEKHIKKVLADPTFTDQIREKFEITLKLDDDNYYYIIALIIAYLSHNNYYNEGCSIEDIYSVGNEFEINKINTLKSDKLSALLEELCELNILRKASDNKYLFSRYSFFEMMGSIQDVEEKLYEFIGD